MMPLKYILPLCMLFLTIEISAQEWPYQTPDYPFINYDTNQLQFFGDSAYSHHLFETLDEIIMEGNSQLSIIQFGGSHIQAGYWSGQIRLRMEKMFPGLGGSLGYVFPFTIANTNIPFHYRTEYEGSWDYSKITDRKPYYSPGAGGMVAHTSDTPAMIMIRPKINSNYTIHKFNKITLFHDTTNSSFIPTIYPDSIVYRAYERKDIGATVFCLNTMVDTLMFYVKKTDSIQDHFNFYGAYLENNETGITYSGIGVNGAGTKSYHKCNYFTQQICAMHPDLVIFSIGVNDAAGSYFNRKQFQINYQIIIDKIREVNPACMFIFTTNNDFYSYYGVNNTKAKEVYEAMKYLSIKNGGAVWDMYTVMGGKGSINIWRTEMLAKRDRIHFTGKGYRLIGDLFFDAFLRAYTDYLTVKHKRIGLD